MNSAGSSQPRRIKPRRDALIKKGKSKQLSAKSAKGVHFDEIIKQGTVASLVKRVERSALRNIKNIIITSTPAKSKKKNTIQEDTDYTSEEDESEGFHTPLSSSLMNLSAIDANSQTLTHQKITLKGLEGTSKKMMPHKNTINDHSQTDVKDTADDQDMEINEQPNPESVSLATVMAMLKKLEEKFEEKQAPVLAEQDKVDLKTQVLDEITPHLNKQFEIADTKVEKIRNDTGHLKYKTKVLTSVAETVSDRTA